MTQDQAELLAIRALGWLAANDELWPVFLGATGAEAGALRDRAQDPEFLGALLDFLLMDDAWVVEAGAALSVTPEALVTARHALPGGAEINWT